MILSGQNTVGNDGRKGERYFRASNPDETEIGGICALDRGRLLEI